MLQLLIEHALIESRNIHVGLKACQNCRGRRVRFTHHKQNFISFIFHQGYCARIIKWIMAKFWSTLYSTSLPYIQLIFTSDLKQQQQQLFFDCMYMFSLVYNFTVMPVILLMSTSSTAECSCKSSIMTHRWTDNTPECSFKKSWSSTMNQMFRWMVGQ